MLYISSEDFFEKVRGLKRISRSEEIDCARRMKEGDVTARERLIEGYLPSVAAHVKRQSTYAQSLGMIMYCHQALEKAVDTFNFFQEGETFAHCLSWHLRQASTKYIAESRVR